MGLPHQYPWYSFNIIDPVFWHVVQDQPLPDLNVYMAYQVSDKCMDDLAEGNHVFIPTYRCTQHHF